MKSLFDRQLVLLSLGALIPLTVGIVVSSSELPVRAETPSASDRAASIEPSTHQSLQQIGTSSYPDLVATQQPLAAPASHIQLASPNNVTAASGSKLSTPATSFIDQQVLPTSATEAATTSTPAISATTATTERQQPQLATTDKPTSTPAPVPGTTFTSAAQLKAGTADTPSVVEPKAKSNTPKVAQLNLSPGRRTRGGSSYVGLGANIGISGGGTGLGNTNFTVFSKIGLTNRFSVRPAAVVGDNSTFLIPLTYDFTILSGDAFSESIPFSPYIGGGIAVSTRDGDNVAPLLSGGVDIPISDQFTATAGVNVGFFHNVDTGITIGIGYNFTRLGI